MKKSIKVYVAGKVLPNSSFGTSFWREGFCRELEEKSGMKIANLDPTSRRIEFDADMVFGRDAFMIKNADLVIVNLTDDLSVGASQEMLIAKYYRKPLLGVARRGGKFVKDEHDDVNGKRIRNYVHPFVHVPCDGLVHDIGEAAEWIRNFFSGRGKRKVKDIKVIENSIRHYVERYHAKDAAAHGMGLKQHKVGRK